MAAGTAAIGMAADTTGEEAGAAGDGVQAGMAEDGVDGMAQALASLLALAMAITLLTVVTMPDVSLYAVITMAGAIGYHVTAIAGTTNPDRLKAVVYYSTT